MRHKSSIVFLLVLLMLVIALTGCGDEAQGNSFVTVKWMDSDGSLLCQEQYNSFSEVPQKDLPADSEKWDYQQWEITLDNNRERIYTATREVNESYFKGNVFQIIVKNLGDVPIATGSGFVFDDDGWFITNAHVLGDAYFATAIFEIENPSLSEAYTYLEIEEAVYKHDDKDLFIGKIKDYDKIKEHFHEIEVTTAYQIGEPTYSVGYPNSSCELMVHKGKVIEDISLLADKLYSGIKYIGSDSYIAPGSSGGVLVDQDLNVIGITTLGWTDQKDQFLYGAAIASAYFKNQIDSVDESALTTLYSFNYPENIDFIKLYLTVKNDPDTKRQDLQDDVVRYTYSYEETGVNSGNLDYMITQTLSFDSDYYIEYQTECYWSDGSRRVTTLYGYFSPTSETDLFFYDFSYTWSDTDYYMMKCTDINYNTNLALTLNKVYLVKKGYQTEVGTEYIEYCKEIFNADYEYLTQWIENCMERTAS